MKLYLASDHAGFGMKEQIKSILKNKGINFEDIGPFEYDALDDYPDFIIPCAEKIANNLENNLGIILGGSGQGEAIVANKVNGIRAVVYYGGNNEIIKLAKLHNNANILSLGARFIKEHELEEIIDLWLNTKFKNEERHVRRIKKITNYERNKFINSETNE